MALVKENAVEGALDAKLTSLSLSEVAWANREYSPTSGTAWYRPTYLFIDSEAVGMGPIALDRIRAMYQIDIFNPLNEGKGPGNIKARALIAAFGRGSTLTQDGVNVVIEKAYRETSEKEDNWWRTPVFIEVRADI